MVRPALPAVLSPTGKLIWVRFSRRSPSYQISIEVKVSGPGSNNQSSFQSGNIFDGGNRTESGSIWVDPIPASPGDAVEFRTMVINTGNVTAKDVTVKVTLPGIIL